MPDGAGDPVRGLSMREPPSNVPAERALLGALLANNRALTQVEGFLRAEHFYDPLHGRVYAAVCQRVAAQGVADAVSLQQVFAQDEMAIEAGGAAAFLTSLLASMVSVMGIAEYGRAVRDTWTRREAIAAAAELINGAFGGEGHPGGISAVMEAHDARLLRIVEGAGDEAPMVQMGAAVREQVLAMEAASRRDSPLAGVTTGYAALDRLTLGLVGGDLILLGARPSMGKTALGLGIAFRAAMSGASVLFWSGEMQPAKLAARAAAAYTGLSTTSVFTGRDWAVPPDADGRPARLHQRDWDRMVEAERAAYTLPLHIDGRPGLTVQALRARARRMRRSKAGLGLIVLDYVGLMNVSGPPPRNQYERLTEISRELVALKKELGVPVLALAQLSRANESRDDKMPQMSDLRDSGALEQDADVIMLLHRPHYYLTRSEPQRRQNESEAQYMDRVAVHEQQIVSEAGRAQVNVLKNRNGATGLTRLRFHDSTTWFRDESEEPDSAAWSASLGT